MKMDVYDVTSIIVDQNGKVFKFDMKAIGDNKFDVAEVIENNIISALKVLNKTPEKFIDENLTFNHHIRKSDGL